MEIGEDNGCLCALVAVAGREGAGAQVTHTLRRRQAGGMPPPPRVQLEERTCREGARTTGATLAASSGQLS